MKAPQKDNRKVATAQKPASQKATRGRKPAVAVKAQVAQNKKVKSTVPAKKTIVVPATAVSMHSSSSAVLKPTKLVWEIADRMVADNRLVTRAEVLNACYAAGVAFYTARTQYQLWKASRSDTLIVKDRRKAK